MSHRDRPFDLRLVAALLVGGCRVELGLGLQQLTVDAGGARDVGAERVDDPEEAAVDADVADVVDVASDRGADDVTVPCGAARMRCGDRCVDLVTDRAHCGACDHACRSDRCVDGDCGEAIRDVGIGDLHVCAARVDGRVYCWGHNRVGQLGDGTTASRGAPTLVPSVDGAVAVAAGPNHTCVRGAGRLSCWGANEHYQLGERVRDANPHPSAVLVEGLPEVATVGIGIAHTCVGTSEGGALCWGAGAQGQLGTGARGGPSSGGLYDDDPEPRAVLDLLRVDGVVAGHEHSCALEEGGAVWCWGASEYVGVADAIPNRPRPVLVEGPGDFVQVAAGTAHTCALRGDGTVWCWGRNDGGQLGIGRDRTESRVPVRVPRLAEVVQVAVAPGGRHTCARDRMQRVYCWGANDRGQLGDGTTDPSDLPHQVTLPRGDIRAIRAGEMITCAITSGGAELWCWGDNLGGNLSVGAPASQREVTSPAQVIGLP